MKKIVAIILILSSATLCYGQNGRGHLREGNRHYNHQRYEQAELAYRRAIEKDSSDMRGHYNLANSLYQQQHYEDALRSYDTVLQCGQIDKKTLSQVHHNMGNSHLKMALDQKDDPNTMRSELEAAIGQYKEALKLNPKNEDTRYNLSYALQKMRQLPPPQSQGGGGQDRQQQNNEQQQQQQSSSQDGNNQQQQQKQPQSGQEQRKVDAERMLDAMKNNERQTLREKAKNEQQSKPRRSNEKDW